MLVHHGSLLTAGRSSALYEAAKRYLCKDGIERRIFRTLEHEPSPVRLRINSHNDDSFDAAARTIHWDPYSALRTREGGRQSPALGLGHEADHATISRRALTDGWNHACKRYDDAEERRVIRGSEAHAARTLGESQRYDHGGTCYRVGSPVDR
ncbi:MAG: hypothetical protein NVS9B12_12910 [Vulcanimicrobiaceae bacterium]